MAELTATPGVWMVSQDDDGEWFRFYIGPRKRRGVFRPKEMDTLRPCMIPLIGREFDFDWMGVSDNNERFPGQMRWMISRAHDDELDKDQVGLWMPDEDIEWVK